MGNDNNVFQLQGTALEAVQTATSRIEELKAEIESIHKTMWKDIEDAHPETVEGNWALDTQYLKQGIVIVKPHNGLGGDLAQALKQAMGGE